jgi:hypothetical protein
MKYSLLKKFQNFKKVVFKIKYFVETVDITIFQRYYKCTEIKFIRKEEEYVGIYLNR